MLYIGFLLIPCAVFIAIRCLVFLVFEISSLIIYYRDK